MEAVTAARRCQTNGTGAAGTRGLQGGGVHRDRPPTVSGTLQAPRRRGALWSCRRGVIGVPGQPRRDRTGSELPSVLRALRVPTVRAELRGQGEHKESRGSPPGRCRCSVAGQSRGCGCEAARLGRPAPQVASGQHLNSCFVHFLISCTAGQRSER